MRMNAEPMNVADARRRAAVIINAGQAITFAGPQPKWGYCPWDFLQVTGIGGDPGAIRTHDPQIRNLMLYPAELRGPGFHLARPARLWHPLMCRTLCLLGGSRCFDPVCTKAAAMRLEGRANRPVPVASRAGRDDASLSPCQNPLAGPAPTFRSPADRHAFVDPQRNQRHREARVDQRSELIEDSCPMGGNLVRKKRTPLNFNKDS